MTTPITMSPSFLGATADYYRAAAKLAEDETFPLGSNGAIWGGDLREGEELVGRVESFLFCFNGDRANFARLLRLRADELETRAKEAGHGRAPGA